jgi:hypothetical protein
LLAAVHMAEHLPQEMHGAPLPQAPQDLADRRFQSLMVVGHD